MKLNELPEGYCLLLGDDKEVEALAHDAGVLDTLIVKRGPDVGLRNFVTHAAKKHYLLFSYYYNFPKASDNGFSCCSWPKKLVTFKQFKKMTIEHMERTASAPPIAAFMMNADNSQN